MKIIDSIISLRILWILITPIENTDAFKLGLIDADGKTIRKAKTPEENAATSPLHRMIWNLKRIISIVPGGKTRIGSLAAGFVLMKECYQSGWSPHELETKVQERFESLCESDMVQADTNAELDQLFETLIALIEDAPVNSTGATVSTDVPTKSGKKDLLRRKFTKVIE